MSKVTPGTHRATINTAQVKVIGEKKSQAFEILFDTDEGSIAWLGYMTEKAYERTLNKLAELQFDETKPPLMDAQGEPYFKASHFGVKEVELVVEMEPDYKDPKKEWPRIKWINLPSGASKAGATVSKLPVDFKAQMAAARARTGVAAPTKSSDEIPF